GGRRDLCQWTHEKRKRKGEGIHHAKLVIAEMMAVHTTTYSSSSSSSFEAYKSTKSPTASKEYRFSFLGEWKGFIRET
ncbi:unnamed protein product, partial [Musa acuminata subsp. burmannicoides]